MLLSPTAAGPIFPVTSVALPPAPGSADKPYVFSITALGERSLVLAHGSAHLTVVDRASLQVTDGWACAEPDGHVTSVVANAAGGEVWTTGQDGVVRTWDSRVKGGRAEGSQASHMRVPGGKVTPLLSLAYAPEHHLLAAGTELTNHEASVVYWDPRAPKAPLYSHTTIHSDDITTLGFAPASLHSLAFPLDPADEVARAPPATSAVLLSGSTDGTLSLTDAREQDEDEAQLGVANVGVSVAEAGWSGGGWDVWGRDDMDGVSVWDAADFTPKVQEPTLRLSTNEGTPDAQAWETDYLIALLPSLPSASTALPLALVGSNTGHMALFNRANDDHTTLQARLNSTHRGHRDVVRSALYHPASGHLYTGSEDGVLCSWALTAPSSAPAPPAADVEMDADPAVDDGDDAAMAEDEELSGGKRRRAPEPAAVLGGDGGWGNVKRGRR